MTMMAVDTNVHLSELEIGSSLQPTATEALNWLARNGVGVIAPQIVREFYAARTRQLTLQGVQDASAVACLDVDRIRRAYTLLPDTPDIFDEWYSLVRRYSVRGKPAHDAHIVAWMLVHGVDTILTFNFQDFRRYREIKIIDPADVPAA